MHLKVYSQERLRQRRPENIAPVEPLNDEAADNRANRNRHKNAHGINRHCVAAAFGGKNLERDHHVVYNQSHPVLCLSGYMVECSLCLCNYQYQCISYLCLYVYEHMYKSVVVR